MGGCLGREGGKMGGKRKMEERKEKGEKEEGMQGWVEDRRREETGL